MRRIQHFILILSTFLLMILGCKEKEMPTYYVSQEMLRYCWFPAGSYWIYQEEGTPWLTDSVYVMSRGSSIFLDEADQNFNRERYGMRIKLRGKEMSQVTIAWPSFDEDDATISRMSEMYNDSFIDWKEDIFFWDSRGKDTMAFQPSLYVHQRFDSLQVWGNTYYDAIEVVRNPPDGAYQTVGMVWGRGVGVLRRVMLDGTSWALVRYHING